VKRDPTDRTDPEWVIRAPCIPPAQARGRPRTTAMREVVTALVDVRRCGCQWRRLPKDFPPYHTVDDYCQPWRVAGGGERRHKTLRGELREAHGSNRAPRAGIIDSQTVQTTDTGGAAARTGGSARGGARATSSWLCGVACWW
jgi:transposase